MLPLNEAKQEQGAAGPAGRDEVVRHRVAPRDNRRAVYFGIGRDQVEDYAARKGMDVATAERWLAPLLGY